VLIRFPGPRPPRRGSLGDEADVQCAACDSTCRVAGQRAAATDRHQAARRRDLAAPPVRSVRRGGLPDGAGSRLARERTVVVEKTVAGTPVLVERDEQPYVGITSTVSMREMGEVLPPVAPRAFGPRAFARLADRGDQSEWAVLLEIRRRRHGGRARGGGRRPRVPAGRRRWRGEGRCVAGWLVRGRGARRAPGHPRAGDGGATGLGQGAGPGLGRHGVDAGQRRGARLEEYLDDPPTACRWSCGQRTCWPGWRGNPSGQCRSAGEEGGVAVEVDVAAADEDGDPAAAELVGVREQCCQTEGAGGFDDELEVGRQQPHR